MFWRIQSEAQWRGTFTTVAASLAAVQTVSNYFSEQLLMLKEEEKNFEDQPGSTKRAQFQVRSKLKRK